MNNYLFRGKSIGDLGIWIYGYYHYDKVLDQHFIADRHTLVRYEVRAETVGQWTGLKDKKDKDIYAGDLLKVLHESNYRFGTTGRVEYISDYGGFAVVGEYHRNQHHNLLNCDLAIEAEVIGNIHDPIPGVNLK